MNNEQQALEILRKIAEGDTSRPLFVNASEDARKVESELRRLQGVEKESSGDAPCGHPARLTIERNGKKLCTLCEWKKADANFSNALSRSTMLDVKLSLEIAKRDNAEKDALRLRRKVKKLKRKLKGEPEKKRTPEEEGLMRYIKTGDKTWMASAPGTTLNPPGGGSNVYRPEAKPETVWDVNTMIIQATCDRAEIEHLRAALEKIAYRGNYGDKPPHTHMIAAWGEWQPVWDFARGALDKKQAEPKAVRTTIKVDGVREAYEKLEDIKADMIASGAVERMIKSEIEKGFGGFKDINGGTVRYLEAKIFTRESGAIRVTQDLRNRLIKINDWMEPDELKDIAASIVRALGEGGWLEEKEKGPKE